METHPTWVVCGLLPAGKMPAATVKTHLLW
jgi:hypothetical protein